jgi:hypothetical protein
MMKPGLPWSQWRFVSPVPENPVIYRRRLNAPEPGDRN